jgi:hypothetical protein
MKLSEVRNQRILFTCLNWGNGHVSRSIGLIRLLSRQENTIFLYCSETQKQVLECYDLAVAYLTGEKFEFHFKGDGNFSREMLRNGFSFRRALKQENVVAEELVRKHEISLVLSDHCYGFRSKSVKSIFVTHQVQLPPKSGLIAQLIHKKWIQRFDWIWIMDKDENQLAGILSSKVENSEYIGWFSRFSETEQQIEPGKTVAIISGPEPYSEQLFNWVLENHSGKDLTIISPKTYSPVPENIKVILDWKQADAEILSAETIISRNGYSTLMDLKFLNKKVILIPTPGQLEQEYLSSIKA